MTPTTPAVDNGRRDTLRWAFGLSLGTTLAPLAGCGGGGADATADTLPQAEVLSSHNGMLDITLNVHYASQALDIANSPSAAYPGPSKRTLTTLRSFNGRYMAPTLVVNAGDTLRIRIDNRLPPNVGGQSALKYLNHQNSTNLHFHGLHVDPKEIRPGVFGDYVVDTPEAGVLPGASRQHELKIPSDHTNGIYWYHPHLHGSSNAQVSSGMFGAILIRDPADKFITSPEIRERVLFLHKLTMTADGKTESFYDSNLPATAFLVNGAYQPTIVMRPGEVQNWHFVNSASFYPFNPVLDGHTLLYYAKDGNVFDRRFRPINRATSTQFDNQNWPGNALYPGNRSSVIVKASEVPGTYYLRSAAAPSSQAEEIVARIVVEGLPMSTPLPLAANLPRYPGHAPISAQEVADHGGVQRSLVLAILNKDSDKLALPIPAGEEWFIPPSDGLFPDTVFATGTLGAKLAPFQSPSLISTVTQTVALNAVEEWTIYNMNGYPHPFHIHVNDSYVIKINGEDVTPFWADTLPLPPGGTQDKPTSITFRMRFTDFTGAYVWHCHALDHEDMGMMQLVEVKA